MSLHRILIVHPDPASRAALASMLMPLGHEIEEATSDRSAVRLLGRGGAGLVLAGIDPGDPEALELLTYAGRKHRQVPVLLMSPGPYPELTERALRLGAEAVLCSSLPANELRAAVSMALARKTPTGPGTGPCDPHGTAAPPPDPIPGVGQSARAFGMIGTDPVLRLLIERAGTIAPTRTPVLIVGERGTGETLLARAIHGMGPHADRPLLTVDCASLTGAEADRDGAADACPSPGAESGLQWGIKLAQALGVTLFLKDISALSYDLQCQLVRALEETEREHRAGLRTPRSDARFLMSAGENLVSLVEQGKFRQDLYHRASVIRVELPPLRRRGADIEQIAEYFRARYSSEFGKKVVGITRDALYVLNKHGWPGNVRELEGVIERGVAVCEGTRITSGHLSFAPGSHTPCVIRPLREALEGPEKRIIVQALEALNWNRQETARALDINRTTLYKKMKRHYLVPEGSTGGGWPKPT